MDAPYYNADPGFRSVDEMFYELENARNDAGYGDLDYDLDRDFDILDTVDAEADDDPETSDDIDDAYDRDREDD